MTGGSSGTTARSSAPLRVALVADLLSEHWPSMDLVADRLFDRLQEEHGSSLQVEVLRPDLRQRDGLQRYVTRYWGYARWLRQHAPRFDVFHVIDHSYAHLVHELPAGRTVVTCHDTDAFMPLVDHAVIKTRLPNVVTRRILSGMRKAAWITCGSAATRDELNRYGFADGSKLSVAHYGVESSMSPVPDPVADASIGKLIGVSNSDYLDLLHVGSCIPRKRIDLLLRIFRAVRDAEPRARLLKAGGRLTPEQQALARELGIDTHIVQLPFLETRVLAALYRRAAVVLVPSEREGFGLPVVEALAAGAPVVATDLPVFREIGGEVVRYAPLGLVPQWAAGVAQVLREQASPETRQQRRDAAVGHAAGFSWSAFAQVHADTYRQIASACAS
jgi:glycosyltransferase involved in cell wall biosynthesis